MLKKLDDVEWKEFMFTDIFEEIQRGKRLTKSNQIYGDIPYVSSKATNNGIDDFIGNKEGVRIFENCITLANSGSVGSAFYHQYKFVASDHITKLKRNNLDKYSCIFMLPLISRLTEKYCFNREISDERIKREKILLPINDSGQPDYEYMSRYMKQKEQELLEKLKSYIYIYI